MLPNTTYRSTESEIMDDLEMEGDLLIKTLDKIAQINQLLGGNGITINGVKTLLQNHKKETPVSFIDMGCGNGDMLRALAKWARQNGFQFELKGVDANQATIDYAIELSQDYPEINYKKQDVLDQNFPEQAYDITLCTLFLHHFEDTIAEEFLTKIHQKSKLGVVINDLHRSKLAYLLFWLITLFISNRMVKNDGLISILRGFKRLDLEAFSDKLKFKSTITWRWAFRYEWIIRK